MTIVKQMEIRSNIKKYIDMASAGDPIIVPRKDNKNVVIISEEEYSRLNDLGRLKAYSNAITSNFERKPDTLPRSSGDIKTDNLNKLELINGLKPGWNGNGAPEFSQSLINKIRMIIEELFIQPEIFPTALQTIQLEFNNSRRDHMEIEIGETDIAEIFIVRYNGEELFEDISSNPDEINRKVRDFYG